MNKVNVYYSPVVCYEVTSENESTFGINVYINGSADSPDPQLKCSIDDLSCDRSQVEQFANFLSANLAMPTHIPELVESFISGYCYS